MFLGPGKESVRDLGKHPGHAFTCGRKLDRALPACPLHGHDFPAVKVPRTQLKPERYAPELPPVVLCPGSHVADIYLHPEPCRFEICLQFLCSRDYVLMPFPDRDRDDDRLDRCYGRREDKPLVVAVYADEGGNAPF